MDKEVLKNQVVIMEALKELLKCQNFKVQSEIEKKLKERIDFTEARYKFLV